MQFAIGPYGAISFTPSAQAVSCLQRRQGHTVALLRSLREAGVGLAQDLEVLATHPAAQGLSSWRHGWLSRIEAERMVELLTTIDARGLERLRDRRPTVCQHPAFLPDEDTRGEGILVDVTAPAAPDALDKMLEEVRSFLGRGWADFITPMHLITLVRVRGMPDLPFFSGSRSELPGAMHMTVPGDAAILAESLTHEAAHFWLHAVEEQEGDLALHSWTDDTWVSPWREDPRPIAGVIHGVHVFSCVTLSLISLVQQSSGKSPGFRSDSVVRRAIKVATQVEEGLTECARCAHLLPLGEAVCRASAARLDQVLDWFEPEALATARAETKGRRLHKITKWRKDGRRIS